MANQNADFAAKYTNANRSADAARYDAELFVTILKKLQKAGIQEKTGPAVLVGILCALRRADVVSELFATITNDKSINETKDVFFAVKEAIYIALAFVGLPNVIPACFGLIGELNKRSISVEPHPDRFVILPFALRIHP
jgi:hypothetical protein